MDDQNLFRVHYGYGMYIGKSPKKIKFHWLCREYANGQMDTKKIRARNILKARAQARKELNPQQFPCSQNRNKSVNASSLILIIDHTEEI